MARIKYLEAIGRQVKRGRPPAGPELSKAVLARLYVKQCRHEETDTVSNQNYKDDGIIDKNVLYGIKNG